MTCPHGTVSRIRSRGGDCANCSNCSSAVIVLTDFVSFKGSHDSTTARKGYDLEVRSRQSLKKRRSVLAISFSNRKKEKKKNSARQGRCTSDAQAESSTLQYLHGPISPIYPTSFQVGLVVVLQRTLNVHLPFSQRTPGEFR